MKFELSRLRNKPSSALGKHAIALVVLVSAGLISTCANFIQPLESERSTLDMRLPAVLTTEQNDSRILRYTNSIVAKPETERLYACDYGSAAYAASSPLPPGVTTKNPVKYRVRMRTKVVVPHTQRKCEQLRVWHALPTTRPWSRVTRVPGIVSLSYLPKVGKLELEDDGASAHVYFEDNAKFQQGQIRYFQSDFEVFSCDRNFDPAGRAVTWKMYTSKDFRGLEVPRTVNPEISALADRFKSACGPIEFVVQSSKWIRDNIKYDASVPYGVEDANAIMENRRGHCGHEQTLFKQLCARAGLPYKGVFGLDLSAPNGVGELSAIRSDYTNAHTWAQVYFSGIGWVEVDTVEGANCFKISRNFVQNNTAFENYAVWVTEGDETREVEWRAEKGKFVCDYGVENLITFSQYPG